MSQDNKIIDFFGHVIMDPWMDHSHISLYVSLFQLWSMRQYRTPFRICRKDAMRLARIKSFATYHKCIKELHNAGYIIYSPSYNPHEGSSIEIIDFEIADPYQNKILQFQKITSSSEICFSVPMWYEVEMYFNELDFQSAEADGFYSLYQSKNWKLSNNKPMKCWKSAARNWMSKIKNNNQKTVTHEANRS